jgi:hypothetical protein
MLVRSPKRFDVSAPPATTERNESMLSATTGPPRGSSTVYPYRYVTTRV